MAVLSALDEDVGSEGREASDCDPLPLARHPLDVIPGDTEGVADR